MYCNLRINIIKASINLSEPHKLTIFSFNNKKITGNYVDSMNVGMKRLEN